MAKTTILGRLTVTNAAHMQGGITECLITILAATTVHQDEFVLSLMHPDPDNPMLPGACYPPLTLNIGQQATLYYSAEMALADSATDLSAMRINYMVDAMVDEKRVAKDGYFGIAISQSAEGRPDKVELAVDFDEEAPQIATRTIPKGGTPESFDLAVDIADAEEGKVANLVVTIDGAALKFPID